MKNQSNWRPLVPRPARPAREGWASAALRLTWRPPAGAINGFIPAANSLPQALRIIQAQR